MSANLKAALWMMAAMTGFTLTTILIRELLVSGINLFEIAFVRVALALVILVPFLARQSFAALRRSSALQHSFRSLFAVASMLMSFYAIGHLPLGEFMALSFTTPLFVVVLSVLFLQERAEAFRWLATGCGFFGMLVIIRPWGLFVGDLEPAVFVMLLASVSVAVTIILVKRFPPGESELAMLFYFCLVSLVLSAAPALSGWTWPDSWQWQLLGLLAILSLASQAMVIRAYRGGEASFVAPFEYSKLLLAAALGYLLYNEVTDLYTWIGAGIIAASTLFILERERRLRRAAALPAGEKPLGKSQTLKHETSQTHESPL